MERDVQDTWKAISAYQYLVGELFEASLQVAGSPLGLCMVTDFTLQFTFQFTNLQNAMISGHRLAGSKPG